MAKRFIVDNQNLEIEENKIEISGEEVKHIQVLRFNIGDEIHINEYICKITDITKKSIRADIISLAKEKGVPRNNLVLFQALLKSDKMEYVVQKSVELGITSFVPITTKNIVVKLDSKDRIKKQDRWNKISKEASKQCDRTDIVNVQSVMEFKEIESEFSKLDAVFFAYEQEISSLRKAIEAVKQKGNLKKNIGILIGAEGGFTKEEAEILSSIKNVYPVSLGERILRAETASLNLISIINYELEM